MQRPKAGIGSDKTSHQLGLAEPPPPLLLGTPEVAAPVPVPELAVVAVVELVLAVVAAD